jgi:hypothetical protein
MRHALRKGLLVAVLHVMIVATLGGKLLVDRATRPRVWARTGPVDPNLPIRGRYVRLQIEVEPGNGLTLSPADASKPVTLQVDDGRLVAVPSAGSRLHARRVWRDGESVAVITQPLAYFIPEHVADPSRRLPGEELWVEVTIPARGAPRPIRLGIKKGGTLAPLELK